MATSNSMVTSKPIHFLPDVWNGAVLGDFAPRLGLAGAVTQAAIFYLPGIGSVCALRDLFACLGKRDALGVILNALALFPILGGFPKTAEVIHNFVSINHALRATRVAAGRASERAAEPRIHNPLAGLSLLLAAATPILLAIPGNFGVPQNWVVVGLAMPPVAIVLGHLALGRAKRHPEAHAHRGTARTALGLGYFYLVVMAIVVWFLLQSGHSVGPFSLPSHG